LSRARRLAVVVGLLTTVVVTGCANDVGSTGDQGYIDGKGIITVLPAAERKTPGPVSGKTLEGEPLSLSSYAGKVIVVNVWGSWCPPCRAEADELGTAARKLAAQGVVFVGINTRDSSPDNGLSFQRRYDVPYSSIYDPGGRNLLAFHRTLTPNSIPGTVVIDRQGRVAASILVEVTSATTLVDRVQDVSK
jgi:thiol-disulfide isomerase/thioredoxin